MTIHVAYFMTGFVLGGIVGIVIMCLFIGGKR